MSDFDEAIDRIVGGLEKKTRVMNPGALHRARPKTVLIVDVLSGETEWLLVEK